jgi:hypothetical protein
LWKYEDEMWTFVSGSVGSDAESVVDSTPRVPDPNAHPGARRYSACWKDNNDHFWLFGGATSSGYLTDTWRFDGKHWAFWGGSIGTGASPKYGAAKTFSFDNQPGSRISTSVSVTTSGSAAYLIGGFGVGVYYADIWKFESDKGWAFWAGTVGTQNQIPGTIKVPSASNHVGSRYGSMIAADDFDNLWIFGGYAFATGMYFNHLSLLLKSLLIICGFMINNTLLGCQEIKIVVNFLMCMEHHQVFWIAVTSLELLLMHYHFLINKD